MDTIDLKGMGVALVTPFASDGTIDFECLGNLIDFQIESGVSYIVALGTTAETPTLSHDERARLKRFIASRVAGRVPLVAGCGGNSTAEIVDELHNCDFTGFNAILSVAPFYNKPSQRGLIAHFKAVAEASPLPVVLYNIPGRTGVNMLPETTLELSRSCQNIIGVKEASGMMSQFNRLIAEAPEGFHVISGDDSLALPTIAIGGSGVISVLGNAYPREFSSMVKMALDGNITEARKIHTRFNQLFTLLFADGNPAGIKCLLSCLGLAEDNLRLPLVPVSEPVRRGIFLAVEKLKS